MGLRGRSYVYLGNNAGRYLDGIEGILMSKDPDRTVVVSVELVRRSLAVRINGYDLEQA